MYLIFEAVQLLAVLLEQLEHGVGVAGGRGLQQPGVASSGRGMLLGMLQRRRLHENVAGVETLHLRI